MSGVDTATNRSLRQAKIDLRYAQTVAELDAVEPLWNALQAHHTEISPDFGSGTPSREPAEAWRIRRAKYERWLKDRDTFFVIAETDGEPVGYAFVTVGPGYASWQTSERLAELETLSVLPEHRGSGIGSALIEATWTRLAKLDVEDMQITTTTTNVDSHYFYEREGFQQRFAVYHGKSPNAS
jgi:GNAT superfamily N-acetyltransferase